MILPVSGSMEMVAGVRRRESSSRVMMAREETRTVRMPTSAEDLRPGGMAAPGPGWRSMG